MAIKDCIAQIRKASGKDALSAEDAAALEKQLTDIVKKARRTDIDELDEAIFKAAEEAATADLVANVIERRNAMLNKFAVVRVMDYIKQVWADDPGLGLAAVLGGINSARIGARNGISQSQGQLLNRYVTGMIARVEQEGLHSQFVSGAMDREVWAAMHALTEKVPSEKLLTSLPKEAVALAKILNEYNEVARLDANAAGAWINKLPGRVIKQMHDQYKIHRAGWDEWRKFVLEDGRLDLERTFEGADNVDDMLKNMYKQFASGEHVKFQKGGVSGFKGFANVGKKLSLERVLHFKNADAAFEYNQRFGVGTLAEGMLYGLEHMGQNTALMRRFGPNAEQTLDDVIQQIGLLLKKGDPDNASKFGAKARLLKRTLWPNITGESRVPGSKMGAQISMAARAVQQQSKLGFATITAIADIPFYGSELKYQGGSMLSGMREAISGLLSGKTSTAKKEVLGMLGVVYDGMRASAAARYDVSDNIPGFFAKTNQLYFKLNGLRWWTDRLRTNFALARSHQLALSANKSWGGLHPDLQRVLNVFGIDEGRWDLIRKGKTTEADGRAYLTPEGIDDLPDAVFVAHLKAKGRATSKISIRNFRTELKDQFGAYFYDRSTTAVIEPNAQTRAIALRGTKPGTVEGELLRHIMLFKSFPIAVLQRVVGRELHGRSVEIDSSFNKLLKSGNGERAALAQLMLWNTVFGYAAMSAKDMLKGKEPRDPTDLKTITASMLQGGALGIYGDFIFGDLKNRYGGGALSTLLGPSAGTFDDVVDIAQRLADGDDVASQTLKTTLQNTPFVNMFYTKWALDYLIVWRMQEWINPGSMQRMRSRMKRDMDQEFMAGMGPRR